MHQITTYATKAQVPYRRDDGPSFKGAQGVVYKANLSSGLFGTDAYAVKEIHLNSAGERTKLENEIKHLRKCDHPNVLKLHEAFQIKDDKWANTYFLVTKPWADASFERFFADLGSSRTGTSSSCKWYIPGQLSPWPSIVKQCILGIQHIHKNLIKHKDLKPANILLLDESCGEVEDPNVRVIIADLGISKASVIGAPTSFDGTKQYMAPEQLARESSTTKSDIFSLGACFAMIQAVLCTKAGLKPWMIAKQNLQGFFAVDKIAEGRFASNVDQILTLLKQMLQDEGAQADPTSSLFCSTLQNMICTMFTANPSERPDADALCEIFQGYEAKASKLIRRTFINLLISVGSRRILREVDVTAITTDRALFELLNYYIKLSLPQVLGVSLSYFFEVSDIRITQYSTSNLSNEVYLPESTSWSASLRTSQSREMFVGLALLQLLEFPEDAVGTTAIDVIRELFEPISRYKDIAICSGSQPRSLPHRALSSTGSFALLIVPKFSTSKIQLAILQLSTISFFLLQVFILYQGCTEMEKVPPWILPVTNWLVVVQIYSYSSRVSKPPRQGKLYTG